MKKHQTDKIRQFIIDSIANNKGNVSSLVAEKYGISRQAVNLHLQNMVNEGILIAKGKTRNKEYAFKTFVSKKFKYSMADEALRNKVTNSYDENRVWLERIRPLIKDISKNTLEICHYGFTEMLNNVFDHSEATELMIAVEFNVKQISITLVDNGVGIFDKIQKELGLEDHLQAILELAKGKLTTDPQHHTGEGIFFSTRMFDTFYIESGILRFVHTGAGKDWLVEEPDTKIKGTGVIMRIDPKSERTCKEVFSKFSTELEEYGFTKTKVPVALARYGDENLISRSQAKRLLTRFDRFKHVVLDFSNVESIGPAFADEIFRVFTRQHPDIKLSCVNTTDDVQKMIRRATNHVNAK